ncbi:MAG: Clp1/GlmU family protein [Candidatus Bathyarchaeia archaeon]
MRLMIKSGKTLLVDGPASVSVISGKVEVFGYTVNSTDKIVIRDGKRLPFIVEDDAIFDISLGENARIEEVDGKTIPPSWVKSFEELLNLQIKHIVAMVLGTIDSGKTSFCTYLTNKLLSKKRTVAILDGDLGQSDIGPPCTVSYAFVTKPLTDLFNLEAENAYFIGVTSPSAAIQKVIDGLVKLEKEILSNNVDSIIINTDGWIEGEEAVNYKVQLVKELNPNITFYIQRKDELMPILNALPEFRKVIIESPPTIKQRSREKRRSLRELGYIKYLKNAKVQSLPLSWLKIEEGELLSPVKPCENDEQTKIIQEILGIKPLQLMELSDEIRIVVNGRQWIREDYIKKAEEFLKKKITIIRRNEEKGLLAGIYNAKRKFLGIGILKDVDYTKKTLKIYTPVSGEISIIILGKVKLEANFKETPVFADAEGNRSGSNA